MRVMAGSDRQPNAPRRKREANVHTCLLEALLIARRIDCVVPEIKFQQFSRCGTAVNDTMEQSIGHAPLLFAAHQSDGFVIEPQNLPAALLQVAIQEADHITDGDFIAPKSLTGLLPDFDIGPIKVDGRVGNQPTFLRSKIKNHRLLASQLHYLTLLGTIRSGIEILDRLADP